VAFIVRILTTGYYVLEQHSDWLEATKAARKRLSGGSVVVRRRDDGVRFSVAELEAFGHLTPEQEKHWKWEHENL
jgi:hypothetical protein